MNEGLTPLHVAASLGQIEGFEVLLRAGANPDTPYDYGSTALEYAVSRRGTD